jgi:endonuclease/exonuclease/phosphatase (EEP) superfamily protein YafD
LIVVLHLAAALLILATLATLLGRTWWAFDLFTHFRLQYVVTAVMLCLVAIVLSAYPTAAVLAGIAIMHGFTMRTLWFGGGTEAGGQGLCLRVVSANVEDSNPTPEKVADFLRAADADLVVLVDGQRHSWRPVLSAIGADYAHRAPKGWRNGTPVILFSRYPILRGSVVRPHGGRRPYLSAEIVVGDRHLIICGVHPASPSTRRGWDSRLRDRQLAHIADSVHAKEQPVIVAGDFNISPWSPHFCDLLAATGLRNAGDGHGWISTWPQWLAPARIPIDHILVSRSIAVTALKRGPCIGSDHFPLIADLQFDAGGPFADAPLAGQAEGR